MRFHLQTDYESDIRLAAHSAISGPYGTLRVAARTAPFVLSNDTHEASWVRLHLRPVGVGLLILSGFFKPASSLGRRGVPFRSAPTNRRLFRQYTVPFPCVLPHRGHPDGISVRCVGLFLRRCGCRASTSHSRSSFAFIIEDVLARWEASPRQ